MKKQSFCILILIFLLTGCNDLKKTIDDTLANNQEISPASAFETDLQELKSGIVENTDKRETAKKKKGILVADLAQLESAERALRSLPEYAGKSIFVYKLVYFYDDGRISIRLQNPENPAYIDEYWYEAGYWKKPKPVRLSKNDAIEKNLVNLDQIPFKNANNVYKILVEKKKEIKHNDQQYTLYAFIHNKKIHWYPTSIENERSSYSITYKEDGTLERFEQK